MFGGSVPDGVTGSPGSAGTRSGPVRPDRRDRTDGVPPDGPRRGAIPGDALPVWLPAPVVTLATRLVHVLAVATLVGGAGLVWLLAARPGEDGPDDGAVAAVAWRYELVFWLAVGVAVPTGVGNLGSMAPAVPRVGTAWGTAFALKIGGLLVLLVGSAFRTALVWGTRSTTGSRRRTGDDRKTGSPGSDRQSRSPASDRQSGAEAAPGSASSPGTVPRVGTLYAATALWLVALLALGVVIAHG